MPLSFPLPHFLPFFLFMNPLWSFISYLAGSDPTVYLFNYPLAVTFTSSHYLGVVGGGSETNLNSSPLLVLFFIESTFHPFLVSPVTIQEKAPLLKQPVISRLLGPKPLLLAYLTYSTYLASLPYLKPGFSEESALSTTLSSGSISSFTFPETQG